MRDVAGEHNATSFMVIQAALAVLLAKISASSDVAVGFPIAGRRDPALDELVGFFVNTLVLRTEVAGDPTFAELLDQVRRRSLAAFEHQDVPFEVLVERLNPTRSLTHHPLIQVMLAWQNVLGMDNKSAAGLTLGDLQATPMPVDTHTARMDLVFHLAQRWTEAGEPAGIGGMVEFRTDVFDADSIETLIKRLRQVLVAMTANPAQRLSSIDLLDADEHARLDQWGNRATLTRPAFPAVSIPALFAAQAARTPEAVAVTFEGLDNLPRTRGGRQPVGPPAGRSWRGPGCSVWRCCSPGPRGDRGDHGGAQNRGGLPADRSGGASGADRVHAYRCSAIAAITTAGLAERLDGCDLDVIDIEDPASPANPARPCRRRLPRTSLTSSTPQAPRGPKGRGRPPPQRHPAVEALDADVPRTAAWTQCHSLAFDFSVWEIWGALLRGGRLVVVSESVARSPEDFHALLAKEQVSVLSRTPSAFYALQTADALRPELGHQLNLAAVVFGGEALNHTVFGLGCTTTPDCRA